MTDHNKYVITESVPLKGGNNIVPIVRKIKDVLRGNPSEDIVVRFDPDNTVILPCSSRYGDDKTNFVHIIREAEVLDGDKNWSPYPTIIHLNGVYHSNQCATIILCFDKNGIVDFLESVEGNPDQRLEEAAQEAGIIVEYIDGH